MLGPWPLSGHYSDAVAGADSVMFHSSGSGQVVNGTTSNTTADCNCNHQGTTTGGYIIFDQAGVHTILYKVIIHGTVYEASVAVTIKGTFTSNVGMVVMSLPDHRCYISLHLYGL